MKWLNPFKMLAAFAAHILSTIAVFCIIGAGAWALHLVRHKRQGQQRDEIVLIAMLGIELLLFVCDMLATAFWATMSTVKAIKEIKGQ